MTRLPLDGAHWVDHLARNALARPDHPALRSGGRTLTWARLQERVAALAAGLAGLGVGPGDRVAILMTNRPEVIETVLAANRLGAIAVPINFRLAPAEVAYILADSGATAVVTDPGLAPLATRASEGRTAPLIVSGAGGSYEGLIASVAATEDAGAHRIDERDPALIMYTSGTTGRPKGAVLTHLNLLMQAVSMIRTHRLWSDDEVYLQAVPLFHIGGIGTMPAPLLNGTTTVIMASGGFDAATTLRTVEEEGVTCMFLVPAQWQALCDEPGAGERARSLRTGSWGGAPAPATLLRRMEEVFASTHIVSVFGQTEMSPPVSSLPAERAIERPGSVGRPVPLTATRIVDDEMVDVALGGVGEIVYRGPTVMAGYWNDPERTAEATAGGWFHSGDLVRADDEGYLYVVDRKKDMIISGGENVYCAEVEDAVAAHPAIAEVAVIGLPHERWGETPVAVVVPVAGGTAPEIADLRTFVADRLAGYKRPTRVVALDTLPRNASGKVRKDVLRAELGSVEADE